MSIQGVVNNSVAWALGQVWPRKDCYNQKKKLPHNMPILERPHLNEVLVTRDGIKILFSKVRSFPPLGDSCFPLSTEAMPYTCPTPLSRVGWIWTPSDAHVVYCTLTWNNLLINYITSCLSHGAHSLKRAYRVQVQRGTGLLVVHFT